MAAAATVTICATIIGQPAIQPHRLPPKRRGPLVDRSRRSGTAQRVREKHSATVICPRNTIGQVQKKAGPPKAKPNAKSWKTVVRIETNENPAAKEP